MFYRLYGLLEEACHELDLAFADKSGLLNQGGASFDRYASALKSLFKEKDKQTQVVSVLEQLSMYVALTVPEESPALEKTRTESRARLLQNMVQLKKCTYPFSNFFSP